MVDSSRQSRRLEGRALVARTGGGFTLEPVQTGPLSPTTIGVRTHWSGVSFGTEFAVLSGKLDWGPFPLTTGYMGAGVVTDVGDQVAGFAVGDRVYYRQNQELLGHNGEVINCAAGVHSSVAVLDPTGTHGAAHIPDDVDDRIASMFVLPAVGLTGVDQAEVGVGDSVVVIGAGAIGLAVVAAAGARGARVLAVDLREASLDAAKVLGAHHIVDARQDIAAAARNAFGGEGADFVFESTGRHDSIDLGISLLREFGCFVWQGNYGDGPVAFDFLGAHRRRIRMVFPCDDGYRPAREAVMSSIGAGWLNWDVTVTDTVEAEDAPEFFHRILAEGTGNSLSASVHWAG